MCLPQRGPDRPPRAVAGSPTDPVVIRLSASANPEDSRWRSGGVRRDAGRWWFLLDRDGLEVSGWFADPHLLRADAWRNCVSAYGGARLSLFRLAWQLPYMHSKPFLYRWADLHCDGGCLETTRSSVFAAGDANVHEAHGVASG